MSNVEELTKALCKASGCHHLCSNTEGCVVEEEAKAILDKYELVPKELPFMLTKQLQVSEKLLINEDKSNNFDVKSNNEIEEIANDINMHCCSLAEQFCGETSCNACLTNFLYNAGYRKHTDRFLVKENGEIIPLLPKQSEGEWISQADGTHYCSNCGHDATFTYDGMEICGVACPFCGAKMKGGE